MIKKKCWALFVGIIQLIGDKIMFLDYVIFGIIDNFVMLIGAIYGLSVERYLPKRFQYGLGVFIGAGLGNATSDFLGGLGSGNLDLAIGTALGCVIGLVFIPLFLKINKMRGQ